eukprot:scaffold1712_cov82-Phaeocystis_antarctica.AAC.1
MPGELCYLTGHGWIKRHIRVFHSVAAHPCLRVKFDGIVLISSVAAAGGGHGERAVAFGRAHQRRGEQQVRPSVHGRQKDQRVGDGGDAGAAPAFVHGSRRRGEVNVQGQHSGLGLVRLESPVSLGVFSRASFAIQPRPRLRTLLDGAGPQAPGVHQIWKSTKRKL